MASGDWDLTFREPIGRLTEGTITVSIKDNQGNLSRIDRVFSVGGTGG